MNIHSLIRTAKVHRQSKDDANVFQGSNEMSPRGVKRELQYVDFTNAVENQGETQMEGVIDTTSNEELSEVNPMDISLVNPLLSNPLQPDTMNLIGDGESSFNSSDMDPQSEASMNSDQTEVFGIGVAPLPNDETNTTTYPGQVPAPAAGEMFQAGEGTANFPSAEELKEDSLYSATEGESGVPDGTDGSPLEVSQSFPPQKNTEIPLYLALNPINESQPEAGITNYLPNAADTGDEGEILNTPANEFEPVIPEESYDNTQGISPYSPANVEGSTQPEIPLYPPSSVLETIQPGAVIGSGIYSPSDNAINTTQSVPGYPEDTEETEGVLPYNPANSAEQSAPTGDLGGVYTPSESINTIQSVPGYPEATEEIEEVPYNPADGEEQSTLNDDFGIPLDAPPPSTPSYPSPVPPPSTPSYPLPGITPYPSAFSSSPPLPSFNSPIPVACSGGILKCKASAHPFVASIIVLASLFYCCLRCRNKGDGLERGEYRAVAAHYAANAFDDTFDDDLSYEELELGYNSEDNDAAYETDGSGFSTKKRGVIEMKVLDMDKHENGGLTLEEMNG